MNIKYPAGCFMWDWDSIFSDRALHVEGKDNRSKALFKWLETNPHLNDAEDLVDRASLLQICLGVGIALGDANLIQFTEGEYPKETPDYLTASTWTVSEHDIFQDYIQKLQEDLLKDTMASRYVNLLNTEAFN